MDATLLSYSHLEVRNAKYERVVVERHNLAVNCSYTVFRAKYGLKQLAKQNFVTGISFLTANHANPHKNKKEIRRIST